MSALRRTVLMCDGPGLHGGGCEVDLSHNEPGATIAEVRGLAFRQGWHYNFYTKRDFCPDCYENLKGAKK